MDVTERKHGVSDKSIKILKAELRVYQTTARLQTSDLSDTLQKIGELELEIKAKEQG